VSDPGATNTIWMVPASGGAPTPLISGGPFCHIQGLAFWNGILYVADTCGTIYKVGPTQPAVITSQPVSTTAAPGGTVTLSVSASGYPLSYQWSFNGTNIAGATNATLTLNNLGAANVGHYTVTISNMLGSVASQSVSLSLFGLQMYAGLNISGPIGASYSVQSTPALGSHNWTTRTNITLTSSQYIYIDYSSSTNAQQVYRAVPLP
jgi:hypothetical protein